MCKLVATARREAFTLIELLAVILVIGLLAALLLPSLAVSKEKGRLTRCRSKLRQISLGLLMYADDHESYPYFLQVLGPSENFVTWADALVAYTQNRWTNDLYRCPSYSKATRPAIYEGGQWTLPEGSYGYNWIGTGELSADLEAFPAHLGLGGFATEPGNPGEGARKENEVAVPSDMAAALDSGGGQRRVSAVPNGYDRFVHRQLLNMAFCDGHVETVLGSRLYERTGDARSRFNYDHQPHPETWQDPANATP